MFKILLIVAVVVAVLWLLRRSTAARRDDKAARPDGLPPPQAIVACAHCGVHLPQRDAVALGGHAYCSGAHADAGPRSTPPP